jgi:hypothetical protein
MADDNLERAALSVPEALRRYGAVITAGLMLRALAERIDDEGRLVIEGQLADDVSLVAMALEDVLAPDGAERC